MALPSEADRSLDTTTDSILKIEDLVVEFDLDGQSFRAVDQVSLTLERGKTLGLVGESGSGKSTVAKSIVRLVQPKSGNIYFENRRINDLSKQEFFPKRKQLQLIFQDPYQSLNPRLTIEGILAEPLRIHFPEMDRKQRRERAAELLESVNLEPNFLDRRPADFSGGQRQRIVIARALAVQPEVLICDEPVSALDVSIQASILNLLKDLQESENLSLLFISHDLAVVEFMCETIAVMKEGKVIEYADAESIYKNPSHPYTQMLIEASSNW